MLKQMGFAPSQIDEFNEALIRHDVTICEDSDDQLEFWDHKTQRSIILNLEDLAEITTPEQLALAFDKGFKQPYDNETEIKLFNKLRPVIAQCIRSV